LTTRLNPNLPRPEPAAGLDAYNAERFARFDLEPRCRENYKRYLANPRSARPDYLPVRLDVENVSRCNLACTMCAVSGWPKRQRAEDMTLEAFRALIDEQHGLVEIKLNGLGEPLMAGDDFFEMIRYARERRIWVRITTNATLLHLRENYQKLAASDVNEVDVSIDGADAATYEAIRVGGDFERVALNCQLLNGYLNAIGRPSAKMWTLVQRANRENLLEHIRLAKRLGFEHLVFSVQLHGWGDPKLERRNLGESVELPVNEAKLLIAFGKSIGVRIAFWDVSEKFDREHLCPWPFERAVATSDGRTVPCCMIANPDAFEIGPGPIGSTWGGEEYVAFRQAHLDGKIPNVCKTCYKEEK